MDFHRCIFVYFSGEVNFLIYTPHHTEWATGASQHTYMILFVNLQNDILPSYQILLSNSHLYLPSAALQKWYRWTTSMIYVFI